MKDLQLYFSFSPLNNIPHQLRFCPAKHCAPLVSNISHLCDVYVYDLLH